MWASLLILKMQGKHVYLIYNKIKHVNCSVIYIYYIYILLFLKLYFANWTATEIEGKYAAIGGDQAFLFLGKC
jgi:hypothetical protein